MQRCEQNEAHNELTAQAKSHFCAVRPNLRKPSPQRKGIGAII